MNVYLLVLGPERFEIYSEPPDDAPVEPAVDAGRLRHWAHRALVQWRELVATAESGEATGRIARWRNAIVCHLAESIAEQRTLWALRKADAAVLLYPASMAADVARRALDRVLGTARRHHGMWLAVDGLLLLASAVLAPIPGPNAIAYYLAFRVVGHGQSCLGAHRGLKTMAWTLTPEARLAELAELVTVPHSRRASRVSEIAEQLMLHRLASYFERVAR